MHVRRCPHRSRFLSVAGALRTQLSSPFCCRPAGKLSFVYELAATRCRYTRLRPALGPHPERRVSRGRRAPGLNHALQAVCFRRRRGGLASFGAAASAASSRLARSRRPFPNCAGYRRRPVPEHAPGSGETAKLRDSDERLSIVKGVHRLSTIARAFPASARES
jgi:hypothetical protein